MSTMRAVCVRAPGDALLVEVERPFPGPGEVLVGVASVGICGSDVEILEGTRPAAYVRYPIIPGHEWAGVVAEVGAGVSNLSPGDRVVAEGIRACGHCDRCREGRTNLCASGYAETGFTHAGAFADLVVVPARLVHVLPREANLEVAALLEPASCAGQGLLDADLRPGMRVAVVGAGTLGLLATALLRLSSPAQLAVFGTRPNRLALAESLGATHVFPAAGEGQLTPDLESAFDLVFEAANRPGGASTAVRLARRGGTVILEGISGGSLENLQSDAFSLKHLRVQGVFGASSAAWTWVVELFSAGLLDLRSLITHRFSLEEHAAAFAVVQDPRASAVKVQLQP